MGSGPMSKVICALALAVVVAPAVGWSSSPEPPRVQAGLEVVATGVLRPLQLAWDGRAVVVLGPGTRGESAAEIYRLSVDGPLPVDLSRQPRISVPFADATTTTIGSLAVDPASGELFLGEENGHRVWRLGADGRLVLYLKGLRRLAGGSALAFDRAGRLVLVDYADPYLSQGEERPPPGLEQLREEDYRGPLVIRLTLDPTIPLPRHVGNIPPLYPRAWGGRAGGALLPFLISVLARRDGDLLLLTSSGELYSLGADDDLALFTRLPRGQYNRTNMVEAPDGTVFVSGGFHVGRVFRVTPHGVVTVVAADLADPAGIALDARGALYIAESSVHRILRVRQP